MISEFDIAGFKGLSIDVKDLKRLNLIGGKNNSGKTSVLEALFLSMDWGTPDMLSRHLQFRGMGAFLNTPESAWYPAFKNFDPKAKIQIQSREIQGGRRSFVVQVVDVPNSGRSRSAEGVSSAVTQAVPAPGTPSLRITCTVSSKPVFDAQIFVSTGNPPFLMKSRIQEQKAPLAALMIARTRSTPQEDATSFGKLDEQKRTADLEAALRILEPDLLGLSVIPVAGQAHIYADVKGISKKVPINLMGDGVTRLMSILLQIANVAGGYLLVDEIENGFHYSVMPDIWKVIYSACKSFRVQLFATSHSYECLSAYAGAPEASTADDYTYMRLDRQDGLVKTTFYDAQKLRDALEGGWEVR